MSEPLTESRIQALLATKFGKTGSICVPNCGAFGWESDLLRLTSRWLCAEYEIKVSRADFRADRAKKLKHLWLETRPSEAPQRCPNYFWYAAPVGVIPVDELPAYAGLVEVVDRNLVVARKAPRLHRQPIAERNATYMLRGVTLRFWQREYARVFNR